MDLKKKINLVLLDIFGKLAKIVITLFIIYCYLNGSVDNFSVNLIFNQIPFFVSLRTLIVPPITKMRRRKQIKYF